MGSLAERARGFPARFRRNPSVMARAREWRRMGRPRRTFWWVGVGLRRSEEVVRRRPCTGREGSSTLASFGELKPARLSPKTLMGLEEGGRSSGSGNVGVEVGRQLERRARRRSDGERAFACEGSLWGGIYRQCRFVAKGTGPRECYSA